MAKKEVFHMKPKHQPLLSQQGEYVMMLNHEKKGEYYVNPCLCNGWTNINSKNRGKRKFFYETKASISSIRMRKICLWCLISKKKGDYYVNQCLSQLTNEL